LYWCNIIVLFCAYETRLTTRHVCEQLAPSRSVKQNSWESNRHLDRKASFLTISSIYTFIHDNIVLYLHDNR